MEWSPHYGNERYYNGRKGRLRYLDLPAQCYVLANSGTDFDAIGLPGSRPSLLSTLVTGSQNSQSGTNSLGTWLDTVVASHEQGLTWPKWSTSILMLGRGGGPPAAGVPNSSGQLRYLACADEGTFDKMMSGFNLSRSLPYCLVTTDRSLFLVERQPGINNQGAALKVTIRTNPSMLKDLAMTLTANINQGTTFMLITGCAKNKDGKPDYILLGEWLETMKAYGGHPLVLVALFFELSHARMTDTYVRLKGEFSKLDADDVEKAMSGSRDLASISKRYKEDKKKYQDLADRLEALISELTIFEHRQLEIVDLLSYVEEQCGGAQQRYMQHYGSLLKTQLRRLQVDTQHSLTKARLLRETFSDYNALLWNVFTAADSQNSQDLAKHSQDLAADSKKDSSVMKGIAFGTLLFLPPTAMATIFAMPIIKWPEDSEPLKLYFFITSPLTLVTVVTLLIYIGVVQTLGVRGWLSKWLGVLRAKMSIWPIRILP